MRIAPAITLSAEQRTLLESQARSRSLPVRVAERARIVLLAASGQSDKEIAAGMAIALPCVAALGRLVESQLFGVTATDPMTIAQATLLLASAALGAAFIPAYRASTVNPTDALRLD